MNTKDNNLFDWRSGAFRMEIGTQDNDPVSAFLKVNNKLFCLTRKNIHSIMTADTIDPEQTNPNIRHTQQNILPYGSDNRFVGGILQQANILFEEGALPKNITNPKAINIAFNFLNEILALNTLVEEYTSEEKQIDEFFNGNPRKDGSLLIPSLPNLEQKIKKIISNADHSIFSIIELVQIFYPEIKTEGWIEQLFKKLKLEKGENNQATIFINEFRDFIKIIRKIRNKIEHPRIVGILNINNYKIEPSGILTKPTIYFESGNMSPLNIKTSEFVYTVVENLFQLFQLLMAHLCNIHAQPFADDKRIVDEIPPDKRRDEEKHVRFRYSILWTK
ncbi:MAG: hypothetical protein PHH83_03945 [Patescibacteria group bacterium]|nr:hypothetical protein [Patescibacteria group bacterium]